MYKYNIRITAANRNHPLPLHDDAHIDALKDAIDKSNHSVTFQRDEKTIELLDYGNDWFRICLSSREMLKSPFMSLRGFSANLLRMDDECGFKNEEQFSLSVYHSAFLNYRLIEQDKIDTVTQLNAIETVQLVVELFMDKSRDTAIYREKVMDVMLDYLHHK